MELHPSASTAAEVADVVPPLAPVPPKERTLNAPNVITVARFFLALVIFALIQHGTTWLLNAGLFVFAVLTDVLDGWIARRYQLITTFGRVMDPFVDKFITGGVFLFLLTRPDTGVSPWMVIIVIGREMLVTSLRGILEQRGLDFSASASGKLKMFLQCAAATLCLVALDPFVTQSSNYSAVLLLRQILLWTMTLVTVWSGWIYIQRAIVLFNMQANPPLGRQR